MDERFVKRFLVPSFVIVILSTTLFYELKHITDLVFFKKKHILIIGVLSAPDNFQQRLNIRNTWLQLVSEISGSAYFIVGNEICEVPPVDRADPYSCIDKPFYLSKDATDDTEFSTVNVPSEDQKLKAPVASFIGFSFYVRKKIVVRKLGVLREVLSVFNSEFRVKLVSGFDNKVLASVTFEPKSVEDGSRILTKAIEPVTLFDEYEALVKLEPKNKTILLPDCHFVPWVNKANVINFIQLWEADSVVPQPFFEHSCPFVFMTYTIVDVETIKALVKQRKTRVKDWQKLNKKISHNLQDESNFFKDIMFVDVIDVYRNLSLKMIKFYKKIVETEYFHYVLKADDDSFIDLLRVHRQLKEIMKVSQASSHSKEMTAASKLRLSKFWWWSFFKEFWKVERSGKWREDQYRSASYPIFPCGGGYVVSKGIVDYIAENEHNLNRFQGEDVSLGIWMSSLPIVHYKTRRTRTGNNSGNIKKKIILKYKEKKSWRQFKSIKSENSAPDSCEWTCTNAGTHDLPLCNKVQISPQKMNDTWIEYISNGRL